MSAFERKNKEREITNVENVNNSKGVVRRGVSGPAPPQTSAPLGKQRPDERVNNDGMPAMGGVQSRESKIGGAFYLDVLNNMQPAEAWTEIIKALNNVSVSDNTVKSSDNYVAYSMKYFQNTYTLARSMLCNVQGEEGLKLEINRHAGDGFAFADEFVKEFSANLGELCSQPVFVEDPELEAAREANQGEEFLDLEADVGHEMVEHWLTSLRPAGGVKYDPSRIYEALSSLGWNCQDEPNYNILKEYCSDIVTPIFEIFLRQQAVDHIPSVYYGSLILNRFAKGGDLEMNNTTVASICAIALAYCNPEAETESKEEITTSKESLKLLFETLEVIAPLVDQNAERDEDMLDAMAGFLNSASRMFGDVSMDDRIQQLASNLNVEIEELVV